MIPFTQEINPRGNTAEQRQADLIRQLRLQNQQLRIIVEDLYKRLDEIEKKENTK